MARRGRPKAMPPTDDPDAVPGTKQLRCYADLYEMIYWVCRATNQTQAACVDPVLRKAFGALYAQHAAIIEQLQANEAAVKQKQGK